MYVIFCKKSLLEHFTAVHSQLRWIFLTFNGDQIPSQRCRWSESVVTVRNRGTVGPRGSTMVKKCHEYAIVWSVWSELSVSIEIMCVFQGEALQLVLLYQKSRHM